MNTATLHSPLNETQVMLLNAFAGVKSEKEKIDIQTMLLNYYQKRVDAHNNTATLSNEQIEEVLNSHLRTPYK